MSSAGPKEPLHPWKRYARWVFFPLLAYFLFKLGQYGAAT